ncbi:MAG: hypothetical protein IKH12_04360 [Clostridia bacterium]|nr:hypothetical protein [Clostridia bacterium]MBR3094803.1 hypothetical protein [Clostridia bacterium]
MTAIVYVSNTGTAKRYAEALAEKTGWPCFAADKYAGTADDAVFLGWVLGGEIQGLKKLRESGAAIRAVGAVGVLAQEADKVREKNCPAGEPFFFLPGAFDVKKQKGLYKLMCGMLVKAIKAKVKNSPDKEGEKILSIFENGVDLYSEEALQEMADSLNN